MKRVSAFVAVAAVALAFSSCTCSSTTPEAPPTPQPRAGGFGMLKPTERQAPDIAKGVVTPKAVEAREAPTVPTGPVEAKLPEDFPTDIPVFDGAKVAAVQKLANDANNVIFTVDDVDAPKVFDFYKSDMEHGGWKTEQEYQGNNQSFLSFKKDGMITNVSVTKDPKSGKRVIAVMYYKEEPLPFPEF
jgi:hypothetical protein